MKDVILIYSFGTFGSPNGFRQTPFISSVYNLNRLPDIESFDLKTSAIQLFPNSRIYAIRKETVSQTIAVSYMVYSYAQEQNSTRKGSFIGVAITCIGKILPNEVIIKLLDKSINHLIEKYTENSIIKVKHSDELALKSIEKSYLQENLSPIIGLEFNKTGDSLVYYDHIKPESLLDSLSKSYDLLNLYDCIYFTDNEEVAKFSHNKGLFEVVNSEGFKNKLFLLTKKRDERKSQFIGQILHNIQEVTLLKENFYVEKENTLREKQQKLKNFDQEIAELEKKKKDLTTYTEKTLKSLEKEISGCDSYVDELNKIVQRLQQKECSYQEFRNIQQKLPKFQPNKSLIGVASSYVAPQRQQPYPKHSPNKSRENNGTRQSPTTPFFEDATNQNIKPQNNDNNFFNTQNLLLIGISLIGIIVLLYLFVFAPKKIEENPTSNTPMQENRAQQTSIRRSETTTILDPEPNQYLMSLELTKTIEKQLSDENMSIEQVVMGIIFKGNPNDIEEHYKYQKGAYIKLLYQENKNSLEIRRKGQYTS